MFKKMLQHETLGLFSLTSIMEMTTNFELFLFLKNQNYFCTRKISPLWKTKNVTLYH